MKTKCFKCGAQVTPEARFCGSCGTPVTDPHAATLVAPFEGGDELLQRVRLVLTGEYEVESELARGGMAVVFKATEVGLGRAVAIKVLPPELGLTLRAVERFKREARMVADLEHPNIIPVYRVGQIGTILYIVMKFVDGRSLDVIIGAQGALPVPVVLYVLRGATRALAYAHDRGIVHRDIKGANLLVDRDGRVMVSDFGVALRAADITLTADGAVIGTPPFMSPEQCAGQRAGPQSDQYSIGIVAFHMLTGSVPFQSDTLAGMMHHHFFTPAPDVRLVRDDVPTALVDVLHVAMAKEPGARFPSTRDMLAAIDAIPFSEADRRESERILRKLAQGDPVARIATRSLPTLPDSPTVALGAVTPPRPRPRRGARIAGAAAGVLLAVGAVWWTNNTSGTATRPRAADSAPASVAVELPPPVTAAVAPPSPTGRLRILTNPPDAVISIDGRRVGVGSVFDLVVATGPRRLRIRAPGYETFDTTIVVQIGETHRLGRITLRGRDAGGGA
ncbi:MAG: protein kinase domain-containing protein [Gemmatimonadales bacterium]